jgi:hypothetical protein
VVFAAGLLLLGCGDDKSKKKKSEEPVRNPALGRPKAGAGDLRRVVDKPKVQSHLHNLGQLYQAFLTEFNQPPKSVAQFAEYAKDDAQLRRLLSEGYYEMVVGKKVSGNGILAYEKKPDAHGRHMIVRGDGSVDTLTTADLTRAINAAD